LNSFQNSIPVYLKNDAFGMMIDNQTMEPLSRIGDFIINNPRKTIKDNNVTSYHKI